MGARHGLDTKGRFSERAKEACDDEDRHAVSRAKTIRPSVVLPLIQCFVGQQPSAIVLDDPSNLDKSQTAKLTHLPIRQRGSENGP